MDIFRFTYIKPGIKSTLIKDKIRFKNLGVTLHQLPLFCKKHISSA